MAVLVDPRTGERYENVPDDQIGKAQSDYGLVSPEIFEASQHPIEAGARAALGTLQSEGQAIQSALPEALGGFAPGEAEQLNAQLAPERARASLLAQANPTAATVGKLAGEAPILTATGGAAGALGGAAAGALGASELAGTVAGLGAESLATGTVQAAQENDLSVGNVAKNSLINFFLGGLLHAPSAYDATFGAAANPLEQAVQSTVQRAGRLGEDLSDPAVAAEHAAQTETKIADTVTRLQSAVNDSIAPVAKNLQAQRDALLSAADSLRAQAPDVAADLEDTAKLPGQRSFEALSELATGDHGPEVSNTLSDLLQDRAIWGDKAVDHAAAVNAVEAAGGDPLKLADAARGIDDDSVQKLLGDLDSHLADKTRLDGAQAFGGNSELGSTVGAAHESFTDTDYERAIKDISDGKYKNTALLSQEAPGLRNMSAKSAADSFDTILQVDREDLNTLAKHEDFESGSKDWTGANLRRQDKWLAEQSDDAQKLVETIQGAGAKSYELKGLGAETEQKITTGLQRIQAAETPGARMAAVDNLKRSLQQQVLRVGRSRTLDEGSQRFLMDAIEKVQEPMRLGLEDKALWGRRLSALQKETNAVYHDSLNAIKLVDNTFAQRGEQIYGETGRRAFNKTANEGAFQRTLAAPEGGGRQLRDALDRTLTAYDELAKARAQYGFSRLDRLDELKSATENIRKQYDFASVLRTAETHAPTGDHVSGGAALGANVALHGAEYVARAHGLPIGQLARQMGWLSSGARFIDQKVKPLLGVKPTELISSADNAVDRVLSTHLHGFRGLDELKNPDFTRNILGEKTRSALRAYGAPVAGAAGIIGGAQALGEGQANAAEPADSHAAYLAQDGARDTTITARAMTDPAYADRLAQRLSGTPSTLEQFQGEHETIQQAFQAQRQNVERMGRDPSAMVDALASSFGALSSSLRDALGAKAMQVSAYLQGQLPPQRGVSMARPNGLPPSALEARSYALKYMTATNPSTAFDDAKRGQLRHEQVGSLQVTWPDLYSDLKSQVLVAMGDGRSTVQQRQRADLLFGFGAALDPAFSPAVVAAAEQGRQAQQKPPAGSPVANKSNSSLTPQGMQALQH